MRVTAVTITARNITAKATDRDRRAKALLFFIAPYDTIKKTEQGGNALKYTIGIDLGGTNIAAGLVSEGRKLICKKSVPTQGKRPAEEILRDMADVALSLIRENGLDGKDVTAIGIGCPGLVDSKNGVIVFTPNLPFRNTDVRKAFREYTEIPVYCGNDADSAALGEAYAGAAAGCDSAVMITLGTGVGGGIIINRHIYSGFNGAGGELGHMVIVKDGEPCNCGRRGCWETYSSATGLIRMTKTAMQAHPESGLWKLAPSLSEVSGRTAFDGLRAGDPTAKEVVDEYVSYLATGLTNIINIFQPEVILLGGGVAKEGQFLCDLLMPQINRERYGRDVPQTQIRPATLGNDAGIIGAAMLGY
ncbi:MAG: ROK family glucokinase [Clostridia bacterium]|nr:ROK family glucokinase [Clostridia bacterium]